MPAALRRLPLLLALGVTACLGDCDDPLSRSARRGDAQVLLNVSYAGSHQQPLPATVYADTLRTVRVHADTLRLYPGSSYYRRKVRFGVREGDGVEVVQPEPAQWLQRTMYEIDDGWNRYVVLDSFDIAPGVPPGSVVWGSGPTSSDTAYVLVNARVHRDSGGTPAGDARGYTARWVPARPR